MTTACLSLSSEQARLAANLKPHDYGPRRREERVKTSLDCVADRWRAAALAPHSLSTAQKNALSFTVLSDAGRGGVIPAVRSLGR